MKIQRYWLKLAAGLAILVVLLLFYVRPSHITREMRESNLAWIGLAGVLHIVGLLLSAYRWKLLLKVQRVEAPMSDLLQSYLIGGFFNNFLPTRVGGDIYRMIDSRRYSGGLLRPFAVILVERLTGIYGLILIGLTAAAFYPRFQEIQNLALALFIIAIVGLLFTLLFYGSDRFAGWLKNSVKRLPARFSTKALDMFEAFWHFSNSKSLVLFAFLLGLLLQFNVIFYYFLISRGLQMPLSLQEASIVMPLLICIQLLPLTPNGIGVKEFAYIYLLGPFGISKPLAVAFSVWDYILTFFYGLIGGVLYLLKK